MTPPVVINFVDGFNVFLEALKYIRETFYINFGEIQLPITDLLLAFLIIGLILDIFFDH